MVYMLAAALFLYCEEGSMVTGLSDVVLLILLILALSDPQLNGELIQTVSLP